MQRNNNNQNQTCNKTGGTGSDSTCKKPIMSKTDTPKFINQSGHDEKTIALKSKISHEMVDSINAHKVHLNHVDRPGQQQQQQQRCERGGSQQKQGTCDQRQQQQQQKRT